MRCGSLRCGGKPAKIIPAGLEFAVMGVYDQLFQSLLGVFGAVGMLIVLDPVGFYAFVGFGE